MVSGEYFVLVNEIFVDMQISNLVEESVRLIIQSVSEVILRVVHDRDNSNEQGEEG